MNKKWIWLVVALAVAAAAVVGIILLLSPGSTEDTTQTTMETTLPEPQPELCYNLDHDLYSRAESPRPVGEDGLYHLRFAMGGVLTELTTADEQLVRQIDSLEFLYLEQDDTGNILSVSSGDSLFTELCNAAHVQSLNGTQLRTNSSMAMNGQRCDITLNENTRVYDVSDGNVSTIAPGALLPMDGVTVYGDENGVAAWIFKVSDPTESRLYWRTERNYDSKTKETAREPDENGIYSIDFYCEGETVTLQCRDRSLVTTIDLDSDTRHFGFTFDSEGYISGILNSAISMRGLLACYAYDVVGLEGSTVYTNNKLSGKNETWEGTLAENCRIYDISKAAYSENRLAQPVDALQPGDRVTVWTDTENRAVVIYITTRLVDCPIYFSTSRKYNSTTGETSREPDAEGWYSVTLLKEGDSEAGVYKTKDKDLMTYLDSNASRCFGIVADENNVIQRVYHPECLFGQSAWSNGGLVVEALGAIVNRKSSATATSITNGVMMPDCKVYNVSTTGEYGALTTLKAGDYIYAFRQPSGELIHIYVVRRCLGADTMYYNLDQRYDSETKSTTRTPDSQGFYSFTLAHNGEKVTLKTDSKALADALDAQSARAVSLLVEDGMILEVNAPNYACGGTQVSHNEKYVGLNQKGKHVTVNADGKESTFAMASDCAIYDVRNGRVRVLDSIPEDATITAYLNINGKAQIVFVKE